MGFEEELVGLKERGEAPEWLTIEGYSTLKGGYLLKDETPRGMWRRCASASAQQLKRPDLEEKFFQAMWKNWLCLASPIAANMGTDRGLPISCFGMHVNDSVDGIMSAMHEVAMLSKHGGGIGTYWGDVRARGSIIRNNGFSDGIIPFLKILDSVTTGISQGGTRRGASSAYLPIEHKDFDEFIKMRQPKGDINRQCLNIHHGVSVTDEFMQKVIDGDIESQRKWKLLLKTRFETGEPYIFFADSAQRDRPECYKANGLSVKTSQLCTEILLHMDEQHSFVCCLSSLNVARWDEWKDSDVVETAIWFLDGVMEEFIQKSAEKPGFERAHNFAKKSRAVGLGVLGFHTLLQNKRFSYGDLQAMIHNGLIFSKMQRDAEKATKDLAEAYGEPEWCEGFNRRNTHLLAVAPTVSNSIISGNVSAGIEPLAANAYAQKTAKGTFMQKNPALERLLEELGKNTEEVWKSIITKNGSVQHLDFLSNEDKLVFETAREINQFVLVRLAAGRQKYLDQGQSLNLFFPSNVDPKYFNEVHLEAWKQNLKTLYYCRTGSVLKGDSASRVYKREITECQMCEG